MLTMVKVSGKANDELYRVDDHKGRTLGFVVSNAKKGDKKRWGYVFVESELTRKLHVFKHDTKKNAAEALYSMRKSHNPQTGSIKIVKSKGN